MLGSQGQAVEPGVTADDRASVPRAVTPPKLPPAPQMHSFSVGSWQPVFVLLQVQRFSGRTQGNRQVGSFLDSDHLGHVIWG